MSNERYRVEEEFHPDTMPIYDSYTNTQLTLSYIASVLNAWSKDNNKKGDGVVNLTLNFYGSDMTPDKVLEIVDRAIRETLQ